MFQLIEPGRPDIIMVIPRYWEEEAEDVDDYIGIVIQAIYEDDKVLTTLLPPLREELKEYEDSYASGDKTARGKDYNLYNLLVAVLTDVFRDQARSGKNYFDRKTDLITYQSRYKEVLGHDEESGEDVVGLKIMLYLVKPA